MRLSVSAIGGTFPASILTDTLYTTPSTDVLQALKEYGSYDYCSMPHPKSAVYAPVDDAKLIYVEYVQRHQRRTPYNLLVDDAFDCSDVTIISGTNIYEYRGGSIEIIVENSTIGSCQYPQLTFQGIEDAYSHGQDLWQVYGTLGLLPSVPDQTVGFRASNSKLTESTAQNVIEGLWPEVGRVRLHQHPSNIDSINKGFPCHKRDTIAIEETESPQWKQHIADLNPVFQQLNSSSGSTRGFARSSAWTSSLDHLCDNFQAKICNGYDVDVDKTTLDKVFAGGDWEWDFSWRSSPNSAKLIKFTEGLFIKEIQSRLKSPGILKYWHTFAHDGDIGPLAGALGIEYLRWPGMASNIAIEVWEKKQSKFVRVLYCGAPLRSTWVQPLHPLGDFIDKLGGYVFDINQC